MSQMILDWSLFAAQLMLGVGMLATLYRMVRGPRAQDRILALDALYVVGLLLLVTLGIRTGSTIYFELAMLIGLLGFVGTVALAKFLMRGEVIE
ncbi:MAG: K+/H+ antiporter subunit F [Devosia sp.]|jgi:multicomponent K+:H+ antiporter subunit F|nr:K+/H+ antiporter subunit F [Devosia sp.]